MNGKYRWSFFDSQSSVEYAPIRAENPIIHCGRLVSIAGSFRLHPIHGFCCLKRSAVRVIIVLDSPCRSVRMFVYGAQGRGDSDGSRNSVGQRNSVFVRTGLQWEPDLTAHFGNYVNEQL